MMIRLKSNDTLHSAADNTLYVMESREEKRYCTLFLLLLSLFLRQLVFLFKFMKLPFALSSCTCIHVMSRWSEHIVHITCHPPTSAPSTAAEDVRRYQLISIHDDDMWMNAICWGEMVGNILY